MKNKISEKIPVPRDNILSRTEKGKAVIFDDKEGEPYLLNETGTLIWQLCDGMLSVREITEETVKQFEGDSAVIEKEVIAFIENLAEKKIVSLT